MERNKKIVLLAHCLLNVNSKVKGLAEYGGVLEKVVLPYIKEGYGIIQMPCPENSFIGPKRFGMSREQYDTVFYREHCRKILAPYFLELLEYQRDGYDIEAFVGIDGSPSCGVKYTCSGYEGGEIDQIGSVTCRDIEGEGIFTDELKKGLEKIGVKITYTSIDERS